jgi:hypothetical protein
LEAVSVISIAYRGNGLYPLATHLWFERQG